MALVLSVRKKVSKGNKTTTEKRRQMENVEQGHKGRRTHSRTNVISFLSSCEEERKILKRNFVIVCPSKT